MGLLDGLVIVIVCRCCHELGQARLRRLKGRSCLCFRGQRFLPLHCDQSEISLTIPLNAADEYAGGGTYFSDLGRALNRDAGGLISFSGRAHHGAHPISSGTRYIIVAFLYEYREEDEAPRRRPL